MVRNRRIEMKKDEFMKKLENGEIIGRDENQYANFVISLYKKGLVSKDTVFQTSNVARQILEEGE